MNQITLNQASHFKLAGGMFPYLRSPDPYERTVVIDKGTEWCPVTWEWVKDRHDIEIVLSPEEVEMVERGRATKKIVDAAELLKVAIDRWLLQEKTR